MYTAVCFTEVNDTIEEVKLDLRRCTREGELGRQGVLMKEERKL